MVCGVLFDLMVLVKNVTWLSEWSPRTVMSPIPCTAKPWCLWHRGYGRTGTPLLVSLYEYRYSETAQSQTASLRLHLISPKPSRSIVDDRPVRAPCGYSYVSGSFTGVGKSASRFCSLGSYIAPST